MNLFVSLYLAALFVAFVPGVLVTLPKGGNRMTILAVHALLFAVVWQFTYKSVWYATEGFQAKAPRVLAPPKAPRVLAAGKDPRELGALKATLQR